MKGLYFCLLFSLFLPSCNKPDFYDCYNSQLKFIETFSRAVESNSTAVLENTLLNNSVKSDPKLLEQFQRFMSTLQEHPKNLPVAMTTFQTFPKSRFIEKDGIYTNILVFIRSYESQLNRELGCFDTKDYLLMTSDDNAESFQFTVINDLSENEISKILPNFTLEEFELPQNSRVIIECDQSNYR